MKRRGSTSLRSKLARVTLSRVHLFCQSMRPTFILTNLKLTGELSLDTDSIAGLTDAVHCNTPDNLAVVFDSMVENQFSYPINIVRILESQLELYFPKMGWFLEDVVAATAGNLFPPLNTIIHSVFNSGLIIPLVVLMLQEIARYILLVRKCLLYLTKATTFDELELFSSRTHYGHLHRHDAAALTQG